MYQRERDRSEETTGLYLVRGLAMDSLPAVACPNRYKKGKDHLRILPFTILLWFILVTIIHVPVEESYHDGATDNIA